MVQLSPLFCGFPYKLSEDDNTIATLCVARWMLRDTL